MKNLHWIIALILSIMVFMGGVFLGTTVKRPIPYGMELVRISFLDSLKNLTPDTIYIDSIIIKEKEVIKKVPVPIVVENDIQFYSDSTINENIWLVINDSIQGKIKHRSLEYKPVIHTTEIHVPYPVIVEKDVFHSPDPSFSWYVGAQNIFHTGFYAGGLELGVNTPKGLNMYVGAVTDGRKPFMTFRIGTTFDLKLLNLIL